MANKRYLLTSDHVNYMVFRYLQEAGFTHSAFTFAHESSVVARAQVDPNNVAPGTLVALIQKGMQFLELEANLEAQDGDVEGEFKMLTPEELLTHDIDQLRQLVMDKREEEQPGGAAGGGGGGTAARSSQPQQQQQQRKERAAPAATQQRGGGDNSAKEKQEQKISSSNKQQQAPVPPAAPATASGGARTTGGAGDQAAAAAAGGGGGAVPMEEEPPAAAAAAPPQQQIELPASSVVTLKGHDSEVYVCAWHPSELLLASGSGDATARIWNLAPGSSSYCKSTVLMHDMKGVKQPDVTTLDWSSDGSLLATGAYDGKARIWTKEGKLKQTLAMHSGPVFALKWNKKSDLLLSGSVDKKTIVWDVKSGEAKQVFEIHTAPTLDVDWRNTTSFATCSSDMHIHLCRIGEAAPIKTWSGHKDEVNAIRWDPSGTLLASCSDDCTAKLWTVKSADPVHSFMDHDKEIYTLRWSPTGPGSAHPNLPQLLATASFDHTVKLWDVEAGRCRVTLAGHTEAVYTVAFSPNGKYIATGSFDKNIFVWSVPDGTLLRSCKGEAGIYEVCWNSAGNKVAACFANKSVCVLDMRL